jgi:lysophospholipase L1-like esterase
MSTKFFLLLSLRLWSLHLWHQPTAALTLPTIDHRYSESPQPQPLNRLSSLHQRRDQEDPNDQSWITKWAAIGDSYSAGIGCGYLLDSGCKRYNYSFPSLINNDDRMGSTSREFQFLACSGAVSTEILETQVPQITDGVEVVTITAGGNDADFTWILIDCIYGVHLTETCDDRLTKAGNLIQSADFRKNINALISATLSKLGENGRIYYVGYAPFFNAETTQCNDASWDVFRGAAYSKLTTALRTRLNIMVSQMNGILGDIVNAADDRVVFVDYSSWVAKVGGQYCEQGIKEPNEDNQYAVFYQRQTVDYWERSETDDMAELSTRDYGNNTFAGQMTYAIEDARASDSSQSTRSTVVNLEERGWKRKLSRVFHPTLMGHSLIANLVLYHMGVERAKMLNRATRPLVAEILPSTCSRANEYQDGKIIPQKIDCADIAELPDYYWFDTDTARDIRVNFCKDVGSKSHIDISQSHDKESGLGLAYPYIMSGPGNTWIEVWVQNAGCKRPTLYAQEAVCRVAIDAIVNQCEFFEPANHFQYTYPIRR